MQLSGLGVVSRTGLAGVLALALAACNTTAGGGGFFGIGGTREKDPAKASEIELTLDDLRIKYCPPLEIRAGTEALAVYERGHDAEAEFIRYQGSIDKTARECRLAGDVISIKIGIAGKVVGGPKGSAGAVTLPVRVAVVKQTGGVKPLYSQLFKVPAALAAPAFRSEFNFIQEIVVKVTPADRDLIVYIGFDEGKKS